jgi:hypothetical protein
MLSYVRYTFHGEYNLRHQASGGVGTLMCSFPLHKR